MRRYWLGRRLASWSILLAAAVSSAAISLPTYATTPGPTVETEKPTPKLQREVPVGAILRVGRFSWTIQEELVLLKRQELSDLIVKEAENERLKRRVKQLEASKAGQPKTITILGIGVGVGITATAVVWALTTRD